MFGGKKLRVAMAPLPAPHGVPVWQLTNRSCLESYVRACSTFHKWNFYVEVNVSLPLWLLSPQSRTDSSKIINDQLIGLSQIIMSNFQSNQGVEVTRHPLPPPMALKTQVTNGSSPSAGLGSGGVYLLLSFPLLLKTVTTSTAQHNSDVVPDPPLNSESPDRYGC